MPILRNNYEEHLEKIKDFGKKNSNCQQIYVSLHNTPPNAVKKTLNIKKSALKVLI